MDQRKRLIGSTVGNGLKNDERDVWAIKEELYDRGYYSKKPDHGVIDHQLSAAIKNYQSDRGLKVDGYMSPGGETEESLLYSPRERNFKANLNAARTTDIIQNLKRFAFVVRDNPDAKLHTPWHEDPSKSAVSQYEGIIDKIAKENNYDPDLIKSIMHMETSRGWYDQPLEKYNLNSSLRPMNVNPKLWGKLGDYSREDLKDPEKNIRAGAELLERIKQRVPDRNIARIATLYNNLPETVINNYGVKVENIYKEKPWKRR